MLHNKAYKIGGPKLCIGDLIIIFLKPMAAKMGCGSPGEYATKGLTRGSVRLTMDSINVYSIKAISLWRHHSTFFFIRDVNMQYRRCISSSYLPSIAGTLFRPELAFNKAKKSLCIPYAYICTIRSQTRVTLSKSKIDKVERSI